MEQSFENTIEKKKIGGGIITLAVLTFIFNAWGLFSSINSLRTLDATNQALESMGVSTVSSTQIIINIVVTLISTVGFILILRWKKVGVYLYYASFVLSLIISFISLTSYNGVMAVFIYIGIAVSLIIPILLAIFLKNKFKYFA